MWSCVDQLSDDALIAGTRRLVGQTNQTLAALLAHLAEVEARGIHRVRACASLYTYCVYELRIPEDAAFRRAKAARLCGRFPALYDAVAAGELHLTGLLLLGAHLTEENHVEVLARARHRTKREIAKLVRQLHPLPDVPARIEPLGPEPGIASPRNPTWSELEASFSPVRELPPGARPAHWVDGAGHRDGAELGGVDRAGAGQSGSADAEAAEDGADRAGADPDAAPQRYKVQFTASQEYVELLERARDLLSRAVPDRSIAEVHLRALRELVAKLGARCTFVDATGRRCREATRLELHHQQPFARGGPATAANLSLRCRAHNALAAERDFGHGFMENRKGAPPDVRLHAEPVAHVACTANRARGQQLFSTPTRRVLRGGAGRTGRPGGVAERVGLGLARLCGPESAAMRRTVLLAAALTLAACSKHDKAAAPAHSAPWRAKPAPSAVARASLMVRYAIEPRGRASFTLKAKKGAPSGALRVARGTLEVDLLDLSKTRGTVGMDLASVQMDAADPGVAPGPGTAAADLEDPSRQAKDWLAVGDNVPEAERARQRWASFRIESIDHTSASAAYLGRRVKASELSPDAGVTEPEAGDAGDAGAPRHEIRAVDLVATGKLLVHGVEAEHTVQLRALFDFPGKPGPKLRPSRIALRTRHPLALSLAAHDIKPRDSEGVFVAEGMKLLGVSVGRTARISLDLTAVPAPAHP